MSFFSGSFTFTSVVLAIVFLVLWLTKRPAGGEPRADARQEYWRGYWDGYRALGARLIPLTRADPPRPEIEQAIRDGFLPAPPRPVAPGPAGTVAPAAAPAARPPRDRTARNLNSLLFVGSLLLIACGALFVIGAGDAVVKFVFTWLLVGALYGGGMALHARSRPLRPAALAFLGAGLGIIPFAGITFHTLVGLGAGPAWALTSTVGLVAYGVAAWYLRSQLVSYLTMAFVLSLAAGLAPAVGVPMLWSLVALVVVALLADVVAWAGPAWVPEAFRGPIEQTGRYTTVLTLAASVPLAPELSLRSYEIVLAVATLQYAVLWLLRRRLLDETVVRALGHVTLYLVGLDALGVGRDPVPFGFVVLGLAVAQIAYSILRGGPAAAPGRRRAERAWLPVMQGVTVVGCVFWLDSAYAAWLTALSLLLVGASSAVATVRFRSPAAAVAGIVASVVLPFVIGRGAVRPPVPWEVLALCFVAASAAVVWAWPRARRRSSGVRAVLLAAGAAYAVVAGVTNAAASSGFAPLVYVALAVVLWTGSFRTGWASASYLGTAAFVAALVQEGLLLELDGRWLALVVGWVGGACLYTVYGVVLRLGDRPRSVGLLAGVWILLGFAVVANGPALVDASSDQALAVGLTVLAGALVLAAEGYRAQRRGTVEAAAYVAVLGAGRLVGLAVPGTAVVLLAHLWAAVLCVVAWWRRDLRVRPVLAAAVLTAVTGGYALAEGGWYQLLFLVEQLALLTAGALTDRSWARRWGLTTSVLAILYLLRGFTFLAFGFLGLALIGVVIWRLVRSERRR